MIAHLVNTPRFLSHSLLFRIQTALHGSFRGAFWSCRFFFSLSPFFSLLLPCFQTPMHGCLYINGGFMTFSYVSTQHQLLMICFPTFCT